MMRVTHFLEDKPAKIRRGLLMTEFLMRELVLIGIVVGIIMIGVEQLMLFLQLDAVVYRDARYLLLSDVLDGSGFPAVYTASAVIMMALLAASVLRRYVISRSVLSIYTAPVGRGWIFAAYFAGGILMLVLLTVAQHVSVQLSALQLEHVLRAWEAKHGERADFYFEPNAVWHAYMRYEFLHFILPRTTGEWVLFQNVHLGAPAVTLMTALAVMARRWRLLIVTAAYAVLLAMLTAELSGTFLFFMLIFAVFAGYRACRMILSGETI